MIVALETSLQELLAGYFGDWLEGNYMPLPERNRILSLMEDMEKHNIIEWSINKRGKMILTISDE